jgi:hypothetical protein
MCVCVCASLCVIGGGWGLHARDRCGGAWFDLLSCGEVSHLPEEVRAVHLKAQPPQRLQHAGKLGCALLCIGFGRRASKQGG